MLVWKVVGDHPVGKRPDKEFTGEFAETDALDYRDELIRAGYENVKVTSRKETPGERIARNNAERQAHKQKLEEKYGVVGHPKADRLYELAWEHGHSSGYSEVEIYYDDFVELVKD